MADSNEVVMPDWQGGVHYAVNDGVWYAGALYLCLVAHTSVLPTDRSTWQKISATTTEKHFGFQSSASLGGEFYTAGFYEFAPTHNDFDPAVTLGSANNSYAAHPFVVTGAVPGDTVTIRVTGTSINDDADRVESDTDDIVIPAGTPVNSYFEVKKFLGQVSLEVVAGTAINCNYGWAKYWDNANQDFTVKGLEATWYSESNTSDSDLALLHHKATGWTYNAGATPTPPTAIARLSTDHSTERNTVNGQPGAWKRTNLDVSVDGSMSEGIIVDIVAGAAKAFTFGNFQLSITT